MTRSVRRGVTALSLTALVLGLSAANGRSTAASGLAVSVAATPGYAGHAFVYAQVTDSSVVYPAPSGQGHQSPYYARWTRHPYGTSSCPWIWAVYVFDRTSGAQVNAPPPAAPQPNFGTTNSVCARPSATPVEEPPVPEASARLDLDLRASFSPPQPVAGTPTLLTARLNSSLEQDLNLYLNMAIEDWAVSSWAVDFGDGASARLPGASTRTLDTPHTYSAAGSYDARVVATITGYAQAARYERFGDVSLVRQAFSVEIGNDTLATAGARPARRYVPPQAEVAVSPALDNAPDPTSAFRHVEALRGAMTTFQVQLLVTREAQIRSGTALIGSGQSSLTGWRYDGPVSDAAPGTGTTPGEVLNATTLLRLQWNQPDRLLGNQLQDYAVPLTLFIQTLFQDGHVANYVFHSSFSITVDFAALSG